ncbi:MAG: isopentenyl phosphate kinase [Candidatus Micrarchaeia archaeon]
MLLIIKLGGSVITDKKKYMTADKRNIARLAKEIAEARKKSRFDLVIVHGAGSFGHMPAKRHGIHKGVYSEKQRLGFADTNYSCSVLSQHVVSALLKEKIPAIVVSPLTVLDHSDKRMKKFNTEIISTLLKAGYVPVMRGDVVLDDVIGGSISSGDEQVPYLARALHANKIIYGVDVDGIFTADPKTNKKAKLIPLITSENISNVLSSLEEAKTCDVTGGMRGKIKELLQNAFVPTYIVNARKPGYFREMILGENVTHTKIILNDSINRFCDTGARNNILT